MDVRRQLSEFLGSTDTPVYLVGGAVRDQLLGNPTHDLDLSIDGDASSLARAFADRVGGAFYVMDNTFDVARVILADGQAREIVDFARVRDGSIEMDLGSRDFTVNAMAADARAWDGAADGVIDPLGGLTDLAASRLRAVNGDVFEQDPVRLLRAVRLEAELGLALEDATLGLVRRDAVLVAEAPGERLRDEFVRILGAPEVLRQLRRMDALGLLDALLPEVVNMRHTEQSPPHVYPVLEHTLHAVAAAEEAERNGYANLAQGAFGAQLREHFSEPTSGGRTRREQLRFALLLHDIGKPATLTREPNGRIRFIGHETVGAERAEPILRRLRFSDREISQVVTLIQNHLRPILLAQQGGVSDRAIHRFFRATGEVGVDVAVHAWCDQRATYGDAMPPDANAALERVIGQLLDRYYHARETVISPPALLDGNAVMRYLDLPPGRKVGEILQELREAQAEGQVRSEQEAIAFIKNFDTRP